MLLCGPRFVLLTTCLTRRQPVRCTVATISVCAVLLWFFRRDTKAAVQECNRRNGGYNAWKPQRTPVCVDPHRRCRAHLRYWPASCSPADSRCVGGLWRNACERGQLACRFAAGRRTSSRGFRGQRFPSRKAACVVYRRVARRSVRQVCGQRNRFER
jgi:hypothetical protein